MTTSQVRHSRSIVGAGGVLLLVALFLPWAEAGGASRTGWELWTLGDVFLGLVAIFAIAAALTGGRIGVFRPDVSLIGATDLLGVLSTTLLAWLILFDFPEGASREPGVFLALIAAATIAGGAGDYRTLRGAPMFPRIPEDESQAPSEDRSAVKPAA